MFFSVRLRANHSFRRRGAHKKDYYEYKIIYGMVLHGSRARSASSHPTISPHQARGYILIKATTYKSYRYVCVCVCGMMRGRGLLTTAEKKDEKLRYIPLSMIYIE